MERNKLVLVASTQEENVQSKEWTIKKNPSSIFSEQNKIILSKGLKKFSRKYGVNNK